MKSALIIISLLLLVGCVAQRSGGFSPALVVNRGTVHQFLQQQESNITPLLFDEDYSSFGGNGTYVEDLRT